MSTIIKQIHAREILDSRGDPTVETTVFLENGSKGTAAVPSGASTGKHEALELRDKDPNRYNGKGVLRAVKNINEVIFKKLKGRDASKQDKIDEMMIKLDGSKNKSNLGANAILSVSLACAYAVADSKKIPLYRYLREIFNPKLKDWYLPMPFFNIFNGGKHADTNLDLQEFMIVPIGTKSFSEAVRYGSEVFHSLKEILKSRNINTGVGDEGGFICNVESTVQPMDMILEAIKNAGYKIGRDISLGLDAAASNFCKGEKCFLTPESQALDPNQLVALYAEWIDKYNIVLIEDGLAEDDWQGWKDMMRKIGRKVQLVGDDLFVTNIERLKKGIKQRVANAILIKLNQIGTLTETLECIKMAQKAEFGTMISHRSGETTDTTIADLAVATNAKQIKTGSLSRGERVCKYNRLMEIEEELEEDVKFENPL